MSAPAPELAGCELMSLARLRDNPDLLRPPEAAIPRLAWSGRVTLLAAREKAGKSTLLAAGVAALSQGAPFLGEATAAGSALWLSADVESPFDIDRRFALFGADPDLTYLAMHWDRRPLSFLSLVAQGRPRVAVIDTLATYAGELVTDAGQASQWVAILRDIVTVARDTGTAFVLNAHASRATGEYRDSTHIGAAVDMILTLSESTEAPEVRRIKARGRWPMSDFSVRLGEDGYTLDAGAPSLDAQVLRAVIAEPGVSRHALTGQLEGRTEAIVACLKRLAADGAIENRGTRQRGKWYAKAACTTPVVPVVPGTTEQDREGSCSRSPLGRNGTTTTWTTDQLQDPEQLAAGLA